MDIAITEVEGKLRANRDEMLIKAATTIFAILAMLGIVMNKLVIVRLKKLTAATGMLASEREVPGLQTLEGADEIGQLATAFNRMVESLKQYRGEVREKERIRGLLLGKIVRVQEEERKRISRELHDQLGQSLSALLLTVQTQESTPGMARSYDGQMETRIRHLIDDVHRLAWEMRPSILDDFGLDSALRKYIEETRKRCPIEIDYEFSASPGLERIPSWIEVILYRAAQEAITNVVRHSNANRASVVLLIQRNDIVLLVTDDGQGFVLPFPTSSNCGLGLIGMKERVAMCGGSCAVESTASFGTTVRVTIPMQEASYENSHYDRR